MRNKMNKIKKCSKMINNMNRKKNNKMVNKINQKIPMNLRLICKKNNKMIKVMNNRIIITNKRNKIINRVIKGMKIVKKKKIMFKNNRHLNRNNQKKLKRMIV